MNTKKKNQKTKLLSILYGDIMRKEYNFSDAIRNPYTNQEKELLTISLDTNTLNYFKDIASKTGIPYQILISSYLKDCVEKKRELILN